MSRSVEQRAALWQKWWKANRETKLKKTAAWREANPEKVRARSAASYAKNAEQMRAKASAWHKANPEKARAQGEKFRAKHPDYGKRWWAAHADALHAKQAVYRKVTRALVNARTAQRRAVKKSATPSWTDHEAIKEVYNEAAYMQLEVDHIVPLQHPLVCGLHVWDNLQLLTRTENIAKGNRFDPNTYVHTF